MPRVPNVRGHMTVNLKQPDRHYSYIDMTKFVWDCRVDMWRRRSLASADRSVIGPRSGVFIRATLNPRVRVCVYGLCVYVWLSVSF